MTDSAKVILSRQSRGVLVLLFTATIFTSALPLFFVLVPAQRRAKRR